MKIDKRALPRSAETVQKISETKKAQSREEILASTKDCKLEQSNKKLATPTHRKKKHISFEKYQELLKQGKTVPDIIKMTSKHIIYFYNALLKGKINLTKEEFEEKYHNGMSLEEISKEKNISREHLTFLREFYGIKRKGATYQKRLKNEKPLSREAKDIIIGSMLGDGHIAKGGYFAEKHSPKQLDYLKWKASYLPEITTEKSWAYYDSIDKRSGNLIKTHCFRTVTHSWIIEMEKLFYKNVDGRRIKVVPDLIAEFMNEKILAIWFMDDGKTDWRYRNGKKVTPGSNPISTFCTDSFSVKDVEFLQELLVNKFDLNSTRNIYRNRINLTTESTLKLHNILKKDMHQAILYKTNEEKYKETLTK